MTVEFLEQVYFKKTPSKDFQHHCYCQQCWFVDGFVPTAFCGHAYNGDVEEGCGCDFLVSPGSTTCSNGRPLCADCIRHANEGLVCMKGHPQGS